MLLVRYQYTKRLIAILAIPPDGNILLVGPEFGKYCCLALYTYYHLGVVIKHSYEKIV